MRSSPCLPRRPRGSKRHVSGDCPSNPFDLGSVRVASGCEPIACARECCVPTRRAAVTREEPSLQSATKGGACISLEAHRRDDPLVDLFRATGRYPDAPLRAGLRKRRSVVIRPSSETETRARGGERRHVAKVIDCRRRSRSRVRLTAHMRRPDLRCALSYRLLIDDRGLVRLRAESPAPLREESAVGLSRFLLGVDLSFSQATRSKLAQKSRKFAPRPSASRGERLAPELPRGLVITTLLGHDSRTPLMSSIRSGRRRRMKFHNTGIVGRSLPVPGIRRGQRSSA